ncbi:hypothetical protein [Streptomyces sp. CS62]|uniref:hypothetical protein n=1 Tax=Streptomyces sp. CS62 TaxID=3119268 RepID=UPI002F934333
MTAIEQYLIDTYRAAQHRDAPPPPPGRHDAAGSSARPVRTPGSRRSSTAARHSTPGARPSAAC